MNGIATKDTTGATRNGAFPPVARGLLLPVEVGHGCAAFARRADDHGFPLRAGGDDEADPAPFAPSAGNLAQVDTQRIVAISLGGDGGGFVALVDEADAALVLAHHWTVTVRRRLDGRDVRYARRMVPTPHGERNLYMHRLLASPEPGQVVDHLDRDGLNNTRANLRCISPSDNTRRGKKPGGAATSRFRGVSWDARTKKWRAQITVKGKQAFLGRFASEDEARQAYETARSASLASGAA